MTDKYQAPSKDLPFVVVNEEKTKNQNWGEDQREEIRVGDLCPACQTGHVDYNGMLNLECEHCKYTLAGCST
jgi:hypothetical protein